MPRGQTRDPKKPEFYDWNHEAKDEHGNHRFPVGTRKHHVGREEFHAMHRSTSLYGKDRGEAHKKAAEAHAKVQTLKGKDLHKDHPLVHAAMAATKKAEAADHRAHQAKIQKGIETHKNMVKAAANPKHPDHEKAKEHMKDFHNMRKAAAGHKVPNNDPNSSFKHIDHGYAKSVTKSEPHKYGDHLAKIKESLDVDPQSMDNRRLSSIARNPNHPLHTHAKAEMDRRRQDGRAKRVATEAKDPNEYDNEGSMMKSQLRQICSANEKLMSMVKDDDNLPEWVQAKVTKATDYIRSVRDYLESEKMEEKTLTPAELKKREKIAKAIERDNPDMPMDKKMAIATATAKRVAESKDDEYHKTLSQTKNSYEGIAALKKKHGMSHTKAVATMSRLMKDSKPEKKLKDTSGRKADRSWAKSKEFDWHANMDEGKVDELKKSTLASYIKKASDDRAKNAYDIGKSGKINYKGLKRRQGINRAVNKMAAESTLDRIKKILDR